MQDRNVRFKRKYDLFTIYLIPGMTMFLIPLDNWTSTDLSVLSSRIGNKLLFMVWGSATGVYYCVYVRYLFRIGRYRSPEGRILMYIAAVFLFMAVMIPYMSEEYPLRADVHVLLAFFSPVLLTFSTIGFLRSLGSHNWMCFRRAWGTLWMVVVCSVLFPLEAGFITSFLEIFIIISLCGYLCYMEQLLAT